jgi:hypothetical protein
MLLKELLPISGDAKAIVVLGGGPNVREMLLVPEQVTQQPYDAADTSAFDSGTTLVAFAGPDPDAHVDPGTLGPALHRLPLGGRVIVLFGWPIEDLPYHALLGPLVDADFQVLQVMPLDKAVRHGWHCAVIAARVDKLAPLRTYLDDTAVVVDGAEPDLRALLRLTAEYTFADLVARPTRRGLTELRERDDAQRQRIRQLEKDLRTRDAELASAQKRVAAANGHLERLRASATYQVGNTIVSVPRSLARVLRRRGNG